jgi:hypothetical protein
MTAVDPNDLILAYRPKAKFAIGSNRNDRESQQPPHFRNFPLRVEQIRALTWMKQQESEQAGAFVEEEVSEAYLAPMGWRAEGRAERPKHVLGGVLADEVGFGKTATTVGLVDATLDSPLAPLPESLAAGYISIKATLIFVPAHLCAQWPSEIAKFTGTKLKVVVIKDMAGFMKTTIDDFEEADIVIASTTLFNPLYWQRASLFAGVESVPFIKDGKASRHFLARLDDAVAGTQRRIGLLKTAGAKAALKAIAASVAAGEAEVTEKVRTLRSSRAPPLTQL